mmetsp:Transcript_67602/g.218321  ORF Transcript_67602/g.218321 Transcript_67602/m.218321 type:complete len:213 (+) Transcript_67602:263-901(+)
MMREGQVSPVLASGGSGTPGLAPRPRSTRLRPPGPTGATVGMPLASRSNSCSQALEPSLSLRARRAPLPPKGLFQALRLLRLLAAKTMPSLSETPTPPVVPGPRSLNCHLTEPSRRFRHSTLATCERKMTQFSRTVGVKSSSMICTLKAQSSLPVAASSAKTVSFCPSAGVSGACPAMITALPRAPTAQPSAVLDEQYFLFHLTSPVCVPRA